MAPTAPVRTPPQARSSPHAPGAAVDQQLARLTEQFEQLRAQVRQAQQLSSLGTAVAMIAHEVNNLLTPILSYADYAVQSGDVELMKKALTVTGKNVRILVRMSERILEISAANPRQADSFPVRAAVEAALESLCRDVSKDGIGLTLDVDANLTVWGDAPALQQVLFNLFLNAREAMADGHSGHLTIRAIEADQKTVLTVRNTGPPIPAELLPHVFDALQTTKPSQRQGRRRCGGLGLALCRDLVEESGGTITVESEAERGTTFTISLPRTGATGGH